MPITQGSRRQVGRGVYACGGLTADERGDPAAGGGLRDHLAAQPAEERSGLGGLGRGGGIDDDDRGVPGGVDDRRVCRGHAWHLAKPCAEPGDPGLRVRAAQVGGDNERAVEPGAEALSQQVVGLPGSERGRVVAGVAERQAHREQRHRQHDQHGQRQGGADPRSPLHRAAPAAPEPPACGGPAPGEQPGDVQPVDGRAREAEDRGQQGERRSQDQGDRDDGGGREAVHERQAHHEQPEQRDHHGSAGEQHGAPGRGEGDDGGFPRRAAFGQSLPVAGDDEQGVVNADTKPDHDHHVRAEGGHGDQVAERLEDAEADAEPGQGGEDRQPHGHHRPEGQQHDHDRRHQPDHLGRAGGCRDDVLDRRAPDRHLQAPMGEAARGIDHPPDGLRGEVCSGGVELDHHEADPAVSRQPRPAAGSERALHAGDMCQRPQGPDQPVDGRGVDGAVERARRAQDHVRAVAFPGREPARQQVLGLLRGRAGEGEVVVQPAPCPLREPDDGHHREQPAASTRRRWS